MSDSRRSYRYESPSPEPVIIERKPRDSSYSPPRTPPSRRRVSFVGSLNPFKRDKQTVIIKESTIRRRRTQKPPRPRSPSPSPPRGPNHIMNPRIGDEYHPLPNKLPPKEEQRSSSSEGSRDKNNPRRRRPKIHQGPHPEDTHAFPIVENPGSNNPSPRRRDSGVFSMEGSPRARQYVDEYGRPTFGPNQYTQGLRDGAQDASERLSAELNKERQARNDAEKAALRAKEEAAEAKAELAQLKRQSWLDYRERKISDREKQYVDEQRRSAEATTPTILRQPREVIVSQPKPPVRFVDEATDAINRARDDAKRRSGGGR